MKHELFSSDLPTRSQGNWTFTRPYWSVQISCPAGPTTRAVCGPRTRPFRAVCGARNVVAAEMDLNVHEKGGTSAAPALRTSWPTMR